MQSFDHFSGEKLSDSLPVVRGRYVPHADLAKSVWFRAGGPAEILFKPADVQDLAFFLKEKPSDVAVSTIGVGSNLLIRDAGIPGVVVRPGSNFSGIFFSGEYVDVGAGLLDRSVAMMCCDEGLTGLEFLASIPGTIGGALRMNAGCYGSEIADVFEAAFALDPRGILHTLTREDMGFSYRHCSIPENWIFIGARFRVKSGNRRDIAAHMENMLAQREASQPVRARTGGSTFANPQGESAWKLIDDAGCRGLKIGGAEMSGKHCNFMINTGTATAADLEMLGEEVRRRVFETSGVELRWEIKRIGLSWDDVKSRREAA